MYFIADYSAISPLPSDDRFCELGWCDGGLGVRMLHVDGDRVWWGKWSPWHTSEIPICRCRDLDDAERGWLLAHLPQEVG